MRLQGISINVVRNEYEYNKYVSEDYRKQYSYEESKPSLPWLIINFNKIAGGEDTAKYANNFFLRMNPLAYFGNINENEAWTQRQEHLELTRDKLPNKLMLEVKKDCNFTALPNHLEVTVWDRVYDETFTAIYDNPIDLADKPKLLEQIDKYCLRQGYDFAHNLLYELVSNKFEESTPKQINVFVDTNDSKTDLVCYTDKPVDSKIGIPNIPITYRNTLENKNEMTNFSSLTVQKGSTEGVSNLGDAIAKYKGIILKVDIPVSQLTKGETDTAAYNIYVNPALIPNS